MYCDQHTDAITEYNNLELALNDNLFDPESLYDYMITKENNLHAKIMKDKDFEMAKLKYKYIDKEIELTKARAELASATKMDNKSEKKSDFLPMTRPKSRKRLELIDEESDINTISDSSSVSVSGKKSISGNKSKTRKSSSSNNYSNGKKQSTKKSNSNIIKI